MNPAVSVVLLTYNEQGNIVALIQAISQGFLTQALDDFEIIVVDDDSPDRTWETVAGSYSHDPRVRVIRRTRERGLGSAFREALANSRGNIIAGMDADGSHPAEVLVELVKKVREGADFIQASRYVRGSRVIRNSNLRDTALILSRMLNLFLRCLLVRSITDYTGAFFACRREVLDKVRIIDGYGEFFIAVLWQARQAGYRISEIPYTNLPRSYGESKTGRRVLDYLCKGWKYVWLALRLRLQLK